MTTTPLFRTIVPVRLNAPDSAYHGHAGTVDAHDLEVARKRDRTITLDFDDDRSTIAFADELEVLDSPGGAVPTRDSSGAA